MADIDWDAIKETLKANAEQAFGHILNGAQTDAANFLGELAADSTKALQDGDEDMLAMIKNQLKVLGEKHRIVAADTSWTWASQQLDLITNVAMQLAASLAPG